VGQQFNCHRSPSYFILYLPIPSFLTLSQLEIVMPRQMKAKERVTKPPGFIVNADHVHTEYVVWRNVYYISSCQPITHADQRAESEIRTLTLIDRRDPSRKVIAQQGCDYRRHHLQLWIATCATVSSTTAQSPSFHLGGPGGS
jgi:hypothetical protein